MPPNVWRNHAVVLRAIIDSFFREQNGRANTTVKRPQPQPCHYQMNERRGYACYAFVAADVSGMPERFRVEIQRTRERRYENSVSSWSLN